ncbi:MAG TPA: hypothetical protein VFV82_04495 [Candidatus Binatia bacterium]|nr:hypothetical protein [Candidatus Binatia bacterium]
MHKLAWTGRFALSYLMLLTLSIQAPAQPQPAVGSGALPSVQSIKSCLNSRESAECLDKLFSGPLKEYSTLEVLQLIQRYEAEDPELRRDCHPVVHAIGRETYRIKGNIHDSFSACDQTCHSGCYHGSVERFLRGADIYAQTDKHPSAAELKQKTALACDPHAPMRLRFQCLHGLGHALMFFSRYQLSPSLEACDGLPDDWSRSSCYGGVFMENVSNATPETRDLSPTDYHYPCNKVAERYRGECYTMQTSRMTEMGLDIERLFAECERAGRFRNQCMVSIGRDLSNAVRIGQSREAAQKCERLSGENRLACMHGVVYALVDNTWDGRYALPFCAALSEELDQNACVRTSAEYLTGSFDKAPAEVAKECAAHLQSPNRCADLVRR